jgi:hypothetical protein
VQHPEINICTNIIHCIKNNDKMWEALKNEIIIPT